MGRALRLNTSFTVRLRGPFRATLAGFLGSFLLVTLGPVLEVTGLLRWPFSGAAMLGGILAGALALASFLRLERYREGTVIADAQGVRLGDERIPREAIKSAYYAPGVGRLRACVRLLGEGGRLLAQVAVPGAAEADALLDALDLGPGRRTLRFPALAPPGSASSRAGYASLLAGCVLLGGAIPLQLPWLIPIGFLVMVVASAALVPCAVHVGADGMLIATRLAPRFVPWSEVVAVEPHAKGIVLRGTRESIVIPISQRVALRDHERVLQQALFARATEALAEYRRCDAPNVAARIARRGRVHAEWLRDLFDREGTFRTAPVLDDQLWSVVESPAADVTARAGAAAVLARTAGEGERARLRVAADACTAPHLRVVLDKAATGASEAEVEEALALLEDDVAVPEVAP